MSWISKRISGGPPVSPKIELIKTINPAGTYITAESNSPPVKGAWGSIGTTTTAYDALIFSVMFPVRNFTYARGLFDLGIGATPVPWIENIWLYPGYNQYPTFATLIPVVVPSGTPLSVRMQTSATAYGAEAYVTLLGIIGTNMNSAASIITLGADTLLTCGAHLSGSTTPFQFGPYTHLTEAIPPNAKWLSFIVGPPVLSPPSRMDATFQLDVAYGTPYNTLIDRLPLSTDGLTDSTFPQIHDNMPIDIPAGDRIAARILSSTADVGFRDMSMVMYLGLGGA